MTNRRRLSWRRFIVMVRGFGPNSATAIKLRNRRFGQPGARGKHDTTGVPIIRGKANVARYFGVTLGDDKAPGSPAEPS